MCLVQTRHDNVFYNNADKLFVHEIFIEMVIREVSRTGKRIDRHIYVFNVLIVMALLVVGDCGLSLNEREKGGGG